MEGTFFFVWFRLSGVLHVCSRPHITCRSDCSRTLAPIMPVFLFCFSASWPEGERKLGYYKLNLKYFVFYVEASPQLSHNSSERENFHGKDAEIKDHGEDTEIMDALPPQSPKSREPVVLFIP